MRKLKKLITAGILAVTVFSLLLSPIVASADSSIPYDTYNYNYWEDIVFTPAAYIPDKSISGTTLGVGGFVNPQDLCVAPDGLVYVADTGNNRVIVVNRELTEAIRVIDSFEHEGKTDTFKAPYGICVSEKDQLYIADSENHRVVVLNAKTGELVKIITDPQSEVLSEDFVFTPLKVTVDYADRVYVIAKGLFQGIMVFEDTGAFTGFYGTIEVKISLWEKFWRKLSTKEERSKQVLFIPTEFTGIDIDEKGFVYASNIDSEGIQAVRRLNPKGQDVIKKGANSNVGGDLAINGTTKYSGVSTIVDVVVRGNGIYSLLDSKRGRIFTYDHEGNMLYIFGGLGTQAGTFTTPVALEAVDNKIVVLDAYRKELLIFQETEYGSLINEAVALRFSGDETKAVEKWEQVLMLDENNELANSGIGKAYLTAGDNKQAMKYLRLGMNRQYYSIAFKRYRNEFLKEYLGYLLSGGVVLVVGAAVLLRWRKKKKNIDMDEDGGAFE